jgi:hypothetical protein
MTQQHAPSINYSLHDTVNWTVRYCGDCGDPCLTTGDTDRCDPCQAIHLDELATLKRTVGEQVKAVLCSSFANSGGMNDPREILCSACGECAATHTGFPTDGATGVCPHCKSAGRIDVDQDDDGNTTVRFLAICAECLEPGALDAKGVCNECNEHAERRTMGW